MSVITKQEAKMILLKMQLDAFRRLAKHLEYNPDDPQIPEHDSRVLLEVHATMLADLKAHIAYQQKLVG
jgi:hypothetical protein